MCLTLILWNAPTNRPLEQAPDTLDRVGVEIPDHPLVGAVSDGLVASGGRLDANVGPELVGVDGLGIIAHGAVDEAPGGCAA